MLLKISKMWYNIIGEEYMLDELLNNKLIHVLVIFIVLDIIFGILGSIIQHKTNSTVGIDGMIRKIGMLFSITGCIILDKIVEIDLVFFLPEALKQYFGTVGISTLFSIIYCLFETLSIFKNMIRCKIPLPNKLKKYIEKLLKEFTSEMKEGENNVK